MLFKCKWVNKREIWQPKVEIHGDTTLKHRWTPTKYGPRPGVSKYCSVPIWSPESSFADFDMLVLTYTWMYWPNNQLTVHGFLEPWVGNLLFTSRWRLQITRLAHVGPKLTNIEVHGPDRFFIPPTRLSEAACRCGVVDAAKTKRKSWRTAPTPLWLWRVAMLPWRL